jgi:hypothetical protein
MAEAFPQSPEKSCAHGTVPFATDCQEFIMDSNAQNAAISGDKVDWAKNLHKRGHVWLYDLLGLGRIWNREGRKYGQQTFWTF